MCYNKYDYEVYATKSRSKEPFLHHLHLDSSVYATIAMDLRKT